MVLTNINSIRYEYVENKLQYLMIYFIKYDNNMINYQIW